MSRMLNCGKGPAVHSPSCAGRSSKYHALYEETVGIREEFRFKAGRSPPELKVQNGKITKVITPFGSRIHGKDMYYCKETYLNEVIHVGEVFLMKVDQMELFLRLGLSKSGGKRDYFYAIFKTGTPPRVHRSISFDALKSRSGDEEIIPSVLLRMKN